jgi:uncharacterized damage-inducible protein DinB
MKETDHISKLFADLYNGNPWLEITITGTLQKLSAAQAAKKVSPAWNTIWEIVNHLIEWRLNVLERIHGKTLETPPTNYILPVKDASEAAWQNTLKRFEASQQKWIEALKNFKEEDFEKKYPVNNLSYYEHIHGIIQHDAYHLGQIVLLAKAA